MNETLLQFKLTDLQAKEVIRILAREEDDLVYKGQYLSPNARDALNVLYEGLCKADERKRAKVKGKDQEADGANSFELRFLGSTLSGSSTRNMEVA